MNRKLFLALSLPLTIALLSGCDQQAPTPQVSNSDSGPVSHVSSSEGAEEAEEEYEDISWENKVKVYYHNDAGNYANKRIWAWSNGFGGAEFTFDNQTDPDDYGVYKVFDLSQAPWNTSVMTKFSFIIKEAGTWSGQSTDTVCPFGKFASKAEGDMITIYSCEGNGGNIDTFLTKKEALGDRVGTAYFADWRTLKAKGAGAEDGRAKEEIGKFDSYELYAFDGAYDAMTLKEKAAAKFRYLIKTESNLNTNDLTITLDNDIKPYLSYTLEARMKDDTSRVKAKIASFTKLYDTQGFQQYTYSGNDLGVRVDGDSFYFKLWAPTSSRVQVKIYTTGTPGDLYPTFTPSGNHGKLFDMERGEHGVWQIAVDDYFYDPEYVYYYTYYVTNEAGTNEIVDPYAPSSGISGKRGAIIDWNRVAEPENWSHIASGDLLTDIERPNELSVYEVHIRDLTADSSWNGESRPGTYDAFIEEGTKVSGDVIRTVNGNPVSSYIETPTGFDHIKEMKVKAIQLLPVFDQDNDERWFKEDGTPVVTMNGYARGDAKVAPSYNWGYNPQNYNCVEGAYSSDPSNAMARIDDFRRLVSKCADNDIRVIMDVVYNHFASVNGHPLNRAVPAYFLRTSEDGSYYDGTGCGNVTASERTMMRKFVVDSVCHWATNYKVKGFRFDLMGCLDIGTMRAVKDALYDIDPDIVVYGEGWAGQGDGGFNDVVSKTHDMTDPNNWPADSANIYSQLWDKGKGSVGGFNDCFRDAMKGNTVYDDIIPAQGFLNGKMNDGTKEELGKGLLGENAWRGANNEQSVNFAACHDNYTLYDQLNYHYNGSNKADIDRADTLTAKAVASANAASLLNQGIGFINGGDEICRQKVMTNENTDAELIQKMADSIRTEHNSEKSWKVGDGIKMASGNYLVRNSYQYGDGVNSYKWGRKLKYYDQYDAVRVASETRNELMGNVFGRAYSEIADRSINNIFDSTYGSNALIALYLQAKVGNSCYMLYGGNFSSPTQDLACANCHIKVLYSSSGYHWKGQEFTITNSLLGAGKLEFLLVEFSSVE